MNEYEIGLVLFSSVLGVLAHAFLQEHAIIALVLVSLCIWIGGYL